jgi:DNA polymerase I-like protein with 3'-5' exonuclease and polymerase domains
VLAQVGGGQGSPVHDRAPLRAPHVITDLGEVHTAAGKLLAGDVFCFDVETLETPEAKANEAPNPRTNRLSWIGLGGPGQVYLIPIEIEHGLTISRAHKEKRLVTDVYGLQDPRSFTPGGKISTRKVDVNIDAVYAPPPVTLSAREVMDALEPLMFSDLGKLGHNVKFDLQTIAKYYGGRLPPGPYHDTIILRHILNEDELSYKLKPLVWDWLKLDKTKYPELGKTGVEHFGMEEAARYLAKDVRYAWLMWKHFFPRLKRKGLLQVYEFEMAFYAVVMAIEQAGFPVERANLRKVRSDLERQIAGLEEAVWAEAGGPFPMSNPHARRWVMFGEGKPYYPTDPKTGDTLSKRALKSQGVRVISRTPKTNTPQLTQPVLEYYGNRGNRMAQWLLDWSNADKLRGTFIEGIDSMLTPRIGALPTIHTGFNQHGTATGRLSSSKPNLQNLPRGSTIRDLFVADMGWTLIVADYDQIELRCLAYEAGEQNMIRIFQEGRDIHREAAAAAMRIPVEDVSPDQRQVGKTLNFATSYGAGPGRIAAVAGVSFDEGKLFLDRYYAQFPAISKWKSRVLREARQRGDRANAAQPPSVVIPPFGRLRRLPILFQLPGMLERNERTGEDENVDWRLWRAERQAINAVIQGFASYITKMAMWDLHYALDPDVAHMVVQVHDEIVLRVREKRVGDVLPLVTSTMSGIRGTDGQPILGAIPLVVSAETGYTWAEAKGK